jgi:hypothetical protein
LGRDQPRRRRIDTITPAGRSPAHTRPHVPGLRRDGPGSPLAGKPPPSRGRRTLARRRQPGGADKGRSAEKGRAAAVFSARPTLDTEPVQQLSPPRACQRSSRPRRDAPPPQRPARQLPDALTSGGGRQRRSPQRGPQAAAPLQQHPQLPRHVVVRESRAQPGGAWRARGVEGGGASFVAAW